MLRLTRVAAFGGCLTAVLLVLGATATSATVTGGCAVTGTGTDTGQTVLTNADVWHLDSDEQVNGEATYPSQTFVHISVYIFGIPIPVYTSSGKDTHGTAGPFQVSDYSKYTRVFAAGGSSDSCTGSVWIIVDDQSAWTNAAGITGVAMLAIGLLGLLAMVFGGRGPAGCASRILGFLLGLALGVGGAAVLMETALLDPRSLVGLGVVIVGALLGISVPFMRRAAPV